MTARKETEMPKPKILFMCVANSCRSQMAEALARRDLTDQFEIHSAGSKPTTVNPRAVHVLQESGMDTSVLRSKSFDDVPRDVDYAISLCGEQELSCPVFPAKVQRLSWPMPDPGGAEGSEEEVLQVFRDVRDAIEQKILEFLDSAEAQKG